VRRQGSTLVADFTGTDPEARGAINCSYSQAMTGAIYGARCFIDPTIPMNEGIFRAVEVILPAGTLVRPGPHAAVNARIVTVTAIIEAMLDAVSKQQPARTAAASGINHMQVLSGRAPDTGRYWIVMDLDFGGVGARASKDGVDTTGANVMGGRGGVPQIEALEAEFPIRFERHALIRDSGGPGRWRGGLGVERSIRMLGDAEVSVRADRMRYPPPGRAGGLPGRAGTWVVNPGQPDQRELPSKKMGVRLAAGDLLRLRTSGGGGFGSPFEREPELVRADVLAGKVSVDEANSVYGVVLRGDDQDVDVAATQAARS
jgi:N-methylhydantoinase B